MSLPCRIGHRHLVSTSLPSGQQVVEASFSCAPDERGDLRLGADQRQAATAAWVSWFNTRRLFGPLGWIPPAEYERNRANSRRP